MVKYKQLFIGFVLSFVISLILGPIVIPLLKRLNIGQSIREEGPQSHLAKSGTPTMGGLIIFISLIISLFISSFLSREIYVLLVCTLGFALIGFIDDYLIVVKKSNLGLKPYQKIIGQVLLAAVLAIYHSKTSAIGTSVIIPFLENQYLNLGIFYIPFIVFVVVGTVNSVNLTDGLDGLASGVTMIILTFFAIISMKLGSSNIAAFSAVLAGACLGFLKHNAYPAKVFMGDTGSLGLGGAVAGIAVLLNLPLIIPIVGGIYFVEALSVIIQVLSFKLRGKRVFLMSPLHHHFEYKGWKETKVVIVFWSVTLLLCFIAAYALI